MKKFLALLIAVMMMVMMVPAMAEAPVAEEQLIGKFVPSIAGKPAPGMESDPVVYFADGTTGEVGAGGLVITPLADIEKPGVDPETVALLQWAYDSILTGGLTAVKDQIEAALAGTELTFDDMICRDLFEVSAYGQLAKWLEEEGNEVQFVLDAMFDANQTVLVIYSDHNQVWHVLSVGEWFQSDCSLYAEKFHIGMKTADLGVFTFMVVADVVEPAVTSPAN